MNAVILRKLERRRPRYFHRVQVWSYAPGSEKWPWNRGYDKLLLIHPDGTCEFSSEGYEGSTFWDEPCFSLKDGMPISAKEVMERGLKFFSGGRLRKPVFLGYL